MPCLHGCRYRATGSVATQMPRRPVRHPSRGARCSSQPQSGRSSQAANAGRIEEFPNESLEFNAGEARLGGRRHAAVKPSGFHTFCALAVAASRALPRDYGCAEDGLFPKRQPGQYPPVAVRKSLRQRLASVVGLDGVLGGPAPEATAVVAPVQTTVIAESEAAEYDPLRDGPLRYCGYANECGCVIA